VLAQFASEVLAQFVAGVVAGNFLPKTRHVAEIKHGVTSAE
jgi:hypothetical protein